MTTAEKVASMKAWYAEHPAPDGPIPYAPGEIIEDAGKFIATQMQMLDDPVALKEIEAYPERTNGRATRFKLAYLRLYTLRQYILSCPKNT